MFTIANPIYDVFFKYLMQDEASATCLLSAVLDEEITLLECLPQEHTVYSQARQEMSIVRFDYRATIRQADGTLKKVLIELQKVLNLDDIDRFRRYLGNNYATLDLVEGLETHLPIITIYLLGFKLDLSHPIIRVGGTYTDAVTRTAIEGTDAFIDALTHQAYFIQIPRLPNKQKTRVERVLALFSQSWTVKSDNKRLEIPDDIVNPDNTPLLQRLSLALADRKMQDAAIEQQNFDKMILHEIDKGYVTGMAEGKAEGMAEGKAEGMAEGKAEGKTEALQETARNMKVAGFTLEQIAQVTGLNSKDIAS